MLILLLCRLSAAVVLCKCYFLQILICVRAIVQSDPAVEVRRAAVLVITLLLQGLGHDTLKVCSGMNSGNV
jgi:hypothetical protein